MQERERYKILVVDDSLLNARVLQEMLEDEYKLGQATSAAEAQKAVYLFQPDLILLDIILPDASGFDLLVKLKEAEDTQQIPVIIMTSLDGDEHEEHGFLLGAVDYIRKPFKKAILKARVDTQMRILKQIQTIEQLGLVDALTEVSNRRYFDRQIQYEWGRAIREREAISLMMIDVDKFKQYNDAYGHPQGDRMLHAVGQTLRNTLNRSVDILCRYGGEEFVAILPGTDIDGAIIVAERMRRAIEEMAVPNINRGLVTQATVSIGVASTSPSVGDSVLELMERADQMLYQAKKQGRNQVQYFETQQKQTQE